jgi:hypothetical protein
MFYYIKKDLQNEQQIVRLRLFEEVARLNSVVEIGCGASEWRYWRWG